MSDMLPGQPDSGVAAGGGNRNSAWILRYKSKWFFAILLTPVFAAISSLWWVINGDWSPFLRTTILFEAVTLFLPAANCVLQSGRKHKTLLILGGAFLAGMIACALAFPLVTSQVNRKCPIHYLLSGSVYLILFYGAYLLHVRNRFCFAIRFLLFILAAILGYVFFYLPSIEGADMLLLVLIASPLEALSIALFLDYLFSRLNPSAVQPSEKKKGIFRRILIGIVYGFIGLIALCSFSMQSEGILQLEKEPAFLLKHVSDPSVIRTLSGKLESFSAILEFTPGAAPLMTLLPPSNEDDKKISSPDDSIRVNHENDRLSFTYKDKKPLYTLKTSGYTRFIWNGSEFLCRDMKNWHLLTFHGDAPPVVRTLHADALCPTPGKQAVFYALDNVFFLEEKDSSPRMIYSAKPFFASIQTRYSPLAVAFTPDFRYIFYECFRRSYLKGGNTLFIFETDTNKVFIYERFGRRPAHLPSLRPLQWKEKK
ncbi:MAG: hypothetical protein BWY31_02372 [Lentisphaerae bacterium ADurb.Bin242]|nr:MAG: hypothetical protein BWY31_02372 [Lentisphaerae bacterium ADurb.Bin242]